MSIKVWLTNDEYALVDQPVPGRLIVEYKGEWLAGEFDNPVSHNELGDAVLEVIREIERNPVMVDHIDE